MAVPFTFLLRRGTAAEWAQHNPVLSPGEPGVETDTASYKLGDGTRTWSALPYSGQDIAALTTTIRGLAGQDADAALIPVNARIDTVQNALPAKADTGTVDELTATLRAEITAARTAAETRAGQLDTALAGTLRTEISTASTADRAAAEARAKDLDQVVLSTVRGEYSVGLRVPNIGLDTDGVPYYSAGDAGAQILLDPEDGNPYFVITG